ncbi:hypothetical protein [Actinocrispum wychmicini]|uniref:DUF5666 domain-containing protein n=1 Tax=Actinocrispum wychmicini TaxID=1213861 RepID=A0A4R2K5U2_9PSEU|nr:hypothetical protein [Actinocrispum wychmicini]TCO65239.1 hypothetical protein EV192_1011027 [Actinocrispum wychmicini]
MTQPQQQPEQVIGTPVGGNIDQELTQAKRGVGKVTIGLGVAVLVVAAFFGGIWVHSATASSNTPAAAGPQGPGGGGRNGTGRPGGGVPGQGGPGGQGGQGGGGFRGGTAGTIDHIDGTTVYVKMQNGTVVKVSTTDSTKVELTQPGKLTDLKAGDGVLVQGQRGSEDNSVTAQAITTRPTNQ